MEATPQVLDKLGELGFDPQFGARPLKRVMQKVVLNALSKEILAGNITNESVIGISLNDNQDIEFINLDEVEI
jgi:ATP-dependent Clp protease ATP-binding subunit ClpB